MNTVNIKRDIILKFNDCNQLVVCRIKRGARADSAKAQIVINEERVAVCPQFSLKCAGF